jgi:hypothetical protein
MGKNRRKQKKTGIGGLLADHWQTIGGPLADWQVADVF